MTTVSLPTPASWKTTDTGETLAPFTSAQAAAEAGRCLYCFDAPCMNACPTHIDIPGFIRKISTGNVRGSARTILRENFLGSTCARVCPVHELCEGACVLNDTDRPVPVGRLQRYATDTAAAQLTVEEFAAPYLPETRTGRSVLVVGSGPAGLSAAAELAHAGHEVTLMERDTVPGGLSTTGIVPLREPVDIALREVDMVRALGVTLELGRGLDTAAQLTEAAEDFDAVFLATGLGHVPDLGIPGHELIRDGLDYVRTAKLAPESLPHARHVVVIGAGNTAIDVATMARRVGAAATVVYRRTAAEMTAYEHEYHFAVSEGINFLFLTSPKEVLTDGAGVVTGLRCDRMELGAPDHSGRRRPQPTGDETVVPCDLIVRAVGQEGYADSPLGLPTDHGYIAVDDAFAVPGLPNVFAGGDAVRVTGTASTVAAVQDGKLAARAITAFLESMKEDW